MLSLVRLAWPLSETRFAVSDIINTWWCKEGARRFGKGKIMHIYLLDIILNEAPQIQFQKQLQEEVETFPHIFSCHKFYLCRVRSTVFSFWRKWLACACCLYNLALWLFYQQSKESFKTLCGRWDNKLVINPRFHEN